MLIKSEGLDGTPEGGGEDKLQERLKKDQEENSSRIRRFSVKYSSERKKSSSLDITEVRPYLLLCGAIALRGDILKDLNVTCVVNATSELPDTPLPSSLTDTILYLRVNVHDKPDSDILSWLDLVTDVIHQVKMSGGRALVHCVAGVSRSATLCLAYLIKYEGYSLHDSYVMLKGLRDIIRPNSGFFGQLVEFEKRITGKQTVPMVYSDYAQACIPQMYEEDYHRWHMLKCRRTGDFIFCTFPCWSQRNVDRSERRFRILAGLLLSTTIHLHGLSLCIEALAWSISCLNSLDSNNAIHWN